jgi:molybdopterin/thiamine biosynthesis adenylyltransferase
LDASNLHRQPLYYPGGCRQVQGRTGTRSPARHQPHRITVETHAVRFAADNALDLVRAHDLVIDCSDNFRTKFLINDAAVLARKPAVFASVYQYEGQLQVFKPEPAHACLRCLWPDATADGLVGNCAEAGVLGPVPGTFGSLQALLALKILLGLPGQLAGELLLLDFTNFSSIKLKARRRAACVAPDCTLIRGIPADTDQTPTPISPCPRWRPPPSATRSHRHPQ